MGRLSPLERGAKRAGRHPASGAPRRLPDHIFVLRIWLTSGCLLLDAGREDPCPPSLGFLGWQPVLCENPRFLGLDFLVFPWILSAESRLINALHEIFSRILFLFILSSRNELSKRSHQIRQAERMDCSWRHFTFISDFPQDIYRPNSSDPLHPKANRYERSAFEERAQFPRISPTSWPNGLVLRCSEGPNRC
jgi:hypothetical protein